MLINLGPLKRYPHAELYRLVVDGYLHEKECGWLGYDGREPGSVQAALNGLAFALTNLENHLVTHDLILGIYRACQEGVNLPNFQGIDAGRFRNHTDKKFDCGFYISLNTTTPKGLTDLLDLVESNKLPGASFTLILQPELPGNMHFTKVEQLRYFLQAANNHALAMKLRPFLQTKRLQYRAPDPGPALDAQRDLLLNNYNCAIPHAVTVDEKLKIIIDLIYGLGWEHLFYDLNLRTEVVGLLNRLLIQNGFDFATFENPNYFYGYSKDELLIELRVAILNTRKILEGEKKLFGFESSAIPASKQEQYQKMIARLTDTMRREAARLTMLFSKPSKQSIFKADYSPLSHEVPETTSRFVSAY